MIGFDDLKNGYAHVSNRESLLLVSVIIPHYNDLEKLACCLEQLRRQSFGRDKFEVIVADNNSAGGIKAVKEIAPDVVVVSAEEQGAGPARNAGAAVARGTYLAFIDSDCIPDKDWLSEGIAALRRFDYVGGQVVTTMADQANPTCAEAFEAAFAFNFKQYIERDRFTGSGNLFVPKVIFQQVGGFRPRVSEDIEWCWRANGMGFHLGYAERAIVSHAARREWSELTRRWDRMMCEDIRLAMERPRWRLRWITYTAVVAASPLAHWLRIVRTPRLIGLGAKSRGICGLFCIRAYRSYRMIRLLLHPRDGYPI